MIWRRVKQRYLPVVVYEWDRITISLLFITFGVVDIVVRDMTYVSVWLELFRGTQFILAGALGIGGVMLKHYRLRATSTILYSCGLATIAVQVILGSGSPTLFLIAAFALLGFADLRRMRPKNAQEAANDVVKFAHRVSKTWR